MVDVAPLSQMDTRWKNKLLGFDNSSTIGSYGCLMTSMTMVANCYGFNETPDTVNEKMKAVQGFQGPLIIPAAYPAALPGMVFRDFVNCENSPAPMAEIDAYLAQGKPVIIEVDYAPQAGLQNHWIVLYEKRGSDYLLRDPYPFPVVTSEVTLLTSRYKFGGSPAQIIQGVVFLEGRGAPAVKPSVTLDKGVRASFPVYATADGLALRSDTLLSDATLIKRVPLGTRLTILEADSTAKPKIGVLNQWIPVLDTSDNTQGLTAAWYTALTPAGSTNATPAPQPPANRPTTLIVKTIEEGVALRSRPEISDAALVKRVPVNSEFNCSESFDAALAKVGVVYQWLKVKDVTNCEYYVAAWYVKAVNGQTALGAKDQGTVSYALPEGAEPEPLIIRAAVDGLALRKLPLIMTETIIKRVPTDSELVVLEEPVAAEAKIGQMGEWFHVRDVEGDEGYVAAWYAVKRPDVIITEDKPLLG
jgi:hypothetical protein